MAHVCDNPECRNHIPLPDAHARDTQAMGYRNGGYRGLVGRTAFPSPKLCEWFYLCDTCAAAARLVGTK